MVSDEIPVCPECDKTNISPSARSQGWYCKDCGATFVDPPTRDSRQHTGLPSASTQRLNEMDPDEFDELVTDGGAAHERAVAALPDHLEYTGDGTVRCTDCSVTGLRPIGHTDGCEHDYTPTREGEEEARP